MTKFDKCLAFWHQQLVAAAHCKSYTTPSCHRPQHDQVVSLPPVIIIISNKFHPVDLHKSD